MIKEFVKNILFNLKKHKNTFTPVFIIGCGRSGTTILGKTLAQHPEIKYLNERRDLWHRAYPEFNIWRKNTKNTQLFADETAVNPEKNTLLRKLFFREQILENAKVVIEKLPINNFRLNFLQKSFPEARYIYLSRNGLEVSKSIEKRIHQKNWFTGNKLKLLKQFSEQKEMGFDGNIKSEMQKGMWEWKLSMDESNLFFKKLSSKIFTHLSYQDFTENTESSLEQIFNFLNLTYSSNLITKLSKDISRKNKTAHSTDDEVLKKIGGEILTKTIANNYFPF